MTIRLPTLRAWQNEALARWEVHGYGVASVVTGGGKTTFAVACAASAISRFPTLRVLVIVPSRALQDQWQVLLAEAQGIGVNDVGTSVESLEHDATTKFVVLVVNTAREAVPKLRDTARWMLIADECHRYGSIENRRAIIGEWRAAVGLSATPTREYDTWFQDHVEPVLGPVIYNYDYEDALRDGVLVPFDLHNYEVPLTSGEMEKYASLTRRIGQLSHSSSGQPGEALERVLLARARVVKRAKARIPAAIQIMHGRRRQRAIVFHEDIDAADEIAAKLLADGHRVETYHSRRSAVGRLKALQLFRTHQVDVLVTCRALDEGFDIPDVEFGLICASTSSTRQRIQRIGRVLRVHSAKDSAVVGTIYATDSERIRLEDEAFGLAGVAGTRWFEVKFG